MLAEDSTTKKQMTTLEQSYDTTLNEQTQIKADESWRDPFPHFSFYHLSIFPLFAFFFCLKNGLKFSLFFSISFFSTTKK